MFKIKSGYRLTEYRKRKPQAEKRASVFLIQEFIFEKRKYYFGKRTFIFQHSFYE